MIRTEDGQLRKENPRVTENLESELAAYKRGLHRAQRTQSLKDDDRWKAVKEAVENRLDTIEKDLDGFEKNDNRHNDLALQRRQTFKAFISMVEDVDASISQFENLINITEKKLSGRKEPASV